MLERQGWQGQEAISYSGDYCLYGEGAGDMPECSDPDFDPTDVTKDMTRMANVYSKDLVRRLQAKCPLGLLTRILRSCVVTVS